MTIDNKLDISVPSPFGWILATQPAFDLSTIMAFRNQLVSLQSSLGAKTNQPQEDTAKVPEPVMSSPHL